MSSPFWLRVTKRLFRSLSPENVLTLEQYEKGGVIRTERIEKASSKYKALVQWARANSTSWQPTPVDYVPQLTIAGMPLHSTSILNR